MLGGGCVCVCHLVTCGEQGLNLGSDETEIVLLAYIIIDVSSNKIVGVQEYVVRPSTIDLNVNFLSETVLQETRLTEHAVKSNGIPLAKAINQFESYLGTLQLRPEYLTLITDGQFPLRQVLHPEACSKQMHLPPEYGGFADLRKDVTRIYQPHQPATSIQEMLQLLEIPHSGDTDFHAKEVKDMINIVQRLIADGYKFSTVETINQLLEPGICSKDEEVDSKCVVRARGLPWQSSDQDIAKFFRGLNIAKGGVALCLSTLGRRNGEALVRFSCPEHRDMALKRHKHHLDSRYIELYEATGKEFVNVAGGSNTEAQAFLTRGANVIIRMRGLPYDCTAEQVIEFFESGEEPCSVMDGPDGVLFVRKPDGRSTGDAFVLFKEETDSAKALAKHRELIGTRYIELFRSTTAEVQQVLNRTMEMYESGASSNAGSVQAPRIATLATVPALLPQHIITSGTRKDCIRLRGLPYEAQVEHILEFLGEHAKSIVFQGVHMVYNSQGQPSGEAFIQMDSETSAFAAAQLRHHRNMSFGKKQRYIEVFQCSGEDMNLVLTGATGAPQLSPKAAAQLLSPGRLYSPTGAVLPAAAQGPPQQVSHPAAGHYPGHHHHPALVYPAGPQLVYAWPPLSPPHHHPPPPATLLIMRHDLEQWGLDYIGGPPTLGMHSAAA